MMLRKFAITLAVMALPLAATPAMAQSQSQPEGLDCMANSYTPQQHERMAILGANADFGDGSTLNAEADELIELALDAVDSCIVSRDWSDDLADYAAIYELGRISEIAFRAGGLLSDKQLEDIDAKLAIGNRDQLWQAVENSLAMNNETSEIGDAVIVGAFVMDVAGSPDEEAAMPIALLLGWMGLQRMGAREFAALQ